MRRNIIHFENIRLKNNAGISLAECYAHSAMLDLDKTGLPITTDLSKVTCKRCNRYAKKAWWGRK